MISREIAYNSISILFDSIPSWGTCHRRLGRHVILASEKTGDSSSSEAATASPDNQCFKCISIVSRSANVLQIHTNGLQERCHPTEELARQSCPTQQNIRERKAQEMMFYKTRSFYGGSAITRTYCPLNGRFRFTYSINDGMETDLECHEPVSEASDCPSGYKFDLHFRGCSFPNFGKYLLMRSISCEISLWWWQGGPYLTPFLFLFYRYELPVFGIMARWKWRDLYELVGHQTTSIRRRT